MDFSAFMADCEEQWGWMNEPERLARAPHPTDRRLAELPDQVPGFATENTLMLLNLAARHLEPDEVYVEVGTWQGLSLIEASRGNECRRLIACDDFSKFGASRDALTAHLAEHCTDGQVEVHEADFREFLELAPWRPSRVGAFFYDGSHRFRDQFDALRLICPSLAPDAAIIIDDTEDLPVRAANDLFGRHVPALDPVLDIRTPRYADPAWWNGIQVFCWQPDAPPASLPVPRSAYLPRLLLWSRFVVYAQWSPRLSGGNVRTRTQAPRAQPLLLYRRTTRLVPRKGTSYPNRTAA